MNIEEIKMDYFENFEELIKTCKMWIRDDDIDAYYRFFEFNCMKALVTAYEKEKENNKELRKYYATRKEVEELREINECLHDSAENYIHKNKVIEKVKEIKDRPVKDEFITATQGKLDTIIDIESLLNEEE